MIADQKCKFIYKMSDRYFEWFNGGFFLLFSFQSIRIMYIIYLPMLFPNLMEWNWALVFHTTMKNELLISSESTN